MKIETSEFYLNTRGNFEVLDITGRLARVLSDCSFHEGQLTVFVSGSTAGITTIEFEPGLVEDLENFFERVAPTNHNYRYEEAWHDGNGHSHIRSSLLKTQMTFPFNRGKLLLGTWQQVVFVEFDNKPRKRQIIVQLLGI